MWFICEKCRLRLNQNNWFTVIESKKYAATRKTTIHNELNKSVVITIMVFVRCFVVFAISRHIPENIEISRPINMQIISFSVCNTLVTINVYHSIDRIGWFVCYKMAHKNYILASFMVLRLFTHQLVWVIRCFFFSLSFSTYFSLIKLFNIVHIRILNSTHNLHDM